MTPGSAPEPRPRDDAKEAVMDELRLFRADCEQWLMVNGNQPDVSRRADRILRLLNAQPVGARGTGWDGLVEGGGS